jgi:hypothetical protein
MDLSRSLAALVTMLSLLTAGCLTEDAAPDGPPIDPFAPVHEDRVVELFAFHDTLSGTSLSMQSVAGIPDVTPASHVVSFRLEEPRTDLEFHRELLAGLAQVRVDVVGPDGLVHRSGESTAWRLPSGGNGHIMGATGMTAEAFPAGDYRVEFRVAGEMELRFTVAYPERVRIDGAGGGGPVGSADAGVTPVN